MTAGAGPLDSPYRPVWAGAMPDPYQLRLILIRRIISKKLLGVDMHQISKRGGHARRASLPVLGTLLAVGLHAAPTSADENLFGYVTGVDTLPKGAGEIYLWATDRRDKGQGDYAAQDYRIEFERGLTDRLTGSLYLNWRHHEIEGAAPIDETGMPEYPDIDRFGFQGVQASLKYNLVSPYTHPVGLSLYVEPGYSEIFKITGQEQQELSLETKLIVQKNFLDDQLVWATNLTPEFEVRKFDGEEDWETELAFEVTSGVSYRFAPKWFGALEARYHSEYPDWPDSDVREHYALFAGPSLHYGAERWWWTLTYLPQLTGRPADASRDEDLHLHEHEKREIRLKVGYNF